MSTESNGAYESNLGKRHSFGRFWRVVFQTSTIIGIIALTALLYNIINSAFSYLANSEHGRAGGRRPGRRGGAHARGAQPIVQRERQRAGGARRR